MGRRRAVGWKFFTDATSGPVKAPLHTVNTTVLASGSTDDRDATIWRSSDDNSVEYDSDNVVFVTGVTSGAIYSSLSIGT